MDEWIAFLKTGEIHANAKARGLQEARERLRVDKLSPKERQEYKNHQEALRYQRSVLKTSWIEGKAEGREEGREEGKKETLYDLVRKIKGKHMPLKEIAELTGLTTEEINQSD